MKTKKKGAKPHAKPTASTKQAIHQQSAPKKKAPVPQSTRATKPPAKAAPRIIALDIQCPTCGAAPKQRCLLLTNPKVDAKELGQMLRFGAAAKSHEAPRPHEARTRYAAQLRANPR